MDLVINRNMVFLSKNLTNVFEVLTQLLGNGIITPSELDKIRNQSPGQEQNYDLLTLVQKKGDKIFSSFLQSLRETGNDHIADLLCTSSLQASGTKIKPVPSKMQHSNSPEEIKLLDGKWWPEKKILIKSFYDRKIDGELIIQKLFTMLQESQNNTTVITQDSLVVSGLGGIGKTSIAKSYAIYYEGEYDYIIWIDCGEGSLINSFKFLARDLNVPNRAELSLKELAVKSFSKLQEWKCLIIYDNAECYIGNEGIRDVLPEFENLYTIITSRNQEWGTDTGYGKISKFCMNVFSEEESLEFLKNSLKTRIQSVDSQLLLKKLGELLGYLPLALQIAVATLYNERITLAEYIEQIVKEDVSDIVEKTFDDYESTIAKTMTISINQIKNELFGEIASNILMVFGYLQPDEVDLDVFDTIETMYSAGGIRNAAIVLEKYSLVNLEKKLNIKSKREFECLSVHRLLQQVIRLNAQDKEKEILRKILQSGTEVNYKLIPCFYAENHEDLKNEFSHIKSQLIFGNELSDLLTERRFGEAAKLSLMIHKSFDRNQSSDEYLLSKYNLAVCLDKNGQKMESTKVLKSLSGELKGEKCGLMEKLKRTLRIKTEAEIELQLKELSDDIPNQHVISTLVDIRQGNIFTSLQIPFEECLHVEDLAMVLHLGLIGAMNNMHSTILSELEEFREVIPKWTYKNGLLSFETWLKVLNSLVTITIKLASKSNDNIVNALRMLFFVARRLLFSTPFKEFPKQSPISQQINTHLRNELQNEGKLEIFSTIVGDLFSIIKSESASNVTKASYEVENFSSSFKEISYSNLSEKYSDNCHIFFPFRDPQLLTSLTLERTVIYLKDLCQSLSQCTKLVKIALKDVSFWGKLIYKIELPKLESYELKLQELNDRHLDFVKRIDYCTFFGDRNLCLWDSIRKLKSYRIKFVNGSVEFNRISQIIALHGTIEVENWAGGHCNCTNCGGVPKSQEMIPTSFNSFLTRFNSNDVNHLIIYESVAVVDLIDFAHIDVVEIWNSKVTCSSNSATRQKKLYLNRVTVYCNHLGNTVPTVDFSFLHVDELEWIGIRNDFIALNKLPRGIRKLTLDDIKLGYHVNIESQSESPSSVEITPFILETLILKNTVLDLQFIPRSVQVLKLDDVNLFGKIPGNDRFRMNKLILIDYQLAQLNSWSTKSLLKHTDIIVINISDLIDHNVRELIQRYFPWSVKSIFIKFLTESDESSYIHFETPGIGKSCSSRDISKEDFEKQRII